MILGEANAIHGYRVSCFYIWLDRYGAQWVLVQSWKNRLLSSYEGIHVHDAGAPKTLYLGWVEAEWNRSVVSVITSGCNTWFSWKKPATCCCFRRAFCLECSWVQPTTSPIFFCGITVSMDTGLCNPLLSLSLPTPMQDPYLKLRPDIVFHSKIMSVFWLNTKIMLCYSWRYLNFILWLTFGLVGDLHVA